MSTASPDIKEKIKPKTDLSPPPMYSVIYMNDEITTIEFVVSSLVEVFDHSVESAHNLCQKIHEDGSSVVAVLPYELAEQKGVEVTVLARNQGFPLLVRLEQSI